VIRWRTRLHDHWFEPAPLEDLALVRITLVGMQVALLLIPYLAVQVGACQGCNPDYQTALTVIGDREFTPLPALKVMLWPFGWAVRPEPMLLHGVWLVTAVAGVLALVGLYTRPSLIVLAAGSTLLVAHAYSYRERHHPEALLTIMLWTLALAPSGARRSLDHLRFRIRQVTEGGRFEPEPLGPTLSPHARWPLRLAQWLLVLIYLSAGTSKLINGGLRWLNGYTLAFYIGDNALERGSAVGVWLAQHLLLVQLLSMGALAVELGFGGVLLWPRLAWLFVLAGLGLHAGIYVLQRAPFPQLMALYVVFVGELRESWPRGKPAVGKDAVKRDGLWTVVYEERCKSRLRWMAVLEWMDLRRRLTFASVERRNEVAPSSSVRRLEKRACTLELVGPDGATYTGVVAVSRLARLLPPLWPLLPLVIFDRLRPPKDSRLSAS
jgi:predicted DCC family thiol-disulfide oxidoreductase YuxK